MRDYAESLEAARDAAREAGALLREHFGAEHATQSVEAHDVKLELDVRSQELITRRLLARFPGDAILGEEGLAGNQSSDRHWIVDPIDGTVNYFYAIPHFCVCIALRDGDDLAAGVVYDPMRDEMWAAARGIPTTLNGRPCRVSARERIGEAIVSVGFAKTSATIDAGLPLFSRLVYQVRKCRMMGSAALDIAYVACGRTDAYIESAVGLWDVAAGAVLVREAGGMFRMTPHPDNPHRVSAVATSGRIDFGV